MPKSAYSTHVDLTRLSRDFIMAYKLNADVCILLCFLVFLTGGQTLSGNQDTQVVIPNNGTVPQLPTTDCFYDSTKYMGAYTTTVTGKTCKNWAHLDPTLQGLPDVSVTVAGNMCRDPDGRGFPWCYTSHHYDWEFCPVPYCQECFYPSQSENYAGYVSIDKDNNTCSSWSDYVAKTGDTSVTFLNNSVADAQNYCRDPKRFGILKCNVKDVLKECDVPQCSHDCMDDPNTNCSLVKQFVCENEYTSATLCAKTCNMCKFGLLPPKNVDPPADLCVDNPDAHCAKLQSIICADTEGSLKLCPRTCQLCSFLYGQTTRGPVSFPTTVGATVTSSITTSSISSSTTTLTVTSPRTSLSTATPTTMKQTSLTPMTTTPTTMTPTTTKVTTTTTIPSPYWLPWGAWECKEQSGACYQHRSRNCSTRVDQDCKTSQGGVPFNIGLCTDILCPEYFTTTTKAPTTTPTATPTTTTLTTTPTTTPKTTPTTRPTTIPTTTPATIPTTTPTTMPTATTTTIPTTSTPITTPTNAPITMPITTTPTSTPSTTPTSMPTTTTTTTPTATPTTAKHTSTPTPTTTDSCQDDPTVSGCGDKDILAQVCQEKATAMTLCRRSCGVCDPCQDDPASIGCEDKAVLEQVCKVKSTAWSLCRRSCGLCDTCWDYLNCSTPGAQKLFCGRSEYGLQYCRKTCGKCDHKPVDVQLNKCGDPVENEAICELLQAELCICNDPDVRALCGNYCDNNCGPDHPFAGSDCKPARRRRRDAFISQVILH